YDLVIEVDNEAGALARVAAGISDAGVNLAAATCMGTADSVELHILVPHAGAARHALALSQLAVSREREVVVVDVEDRPGVLADLTRKVANAGVDLDLVYVAPRDRLDFAAARPPRVRPRGPRRPQSGPRAGLIRPASARQSAPPAADGAGLDGSAAATPPVRAR